jgi:hypothetical protein
LEEEGQRRDHEIDGKMLCRGMQPTCSGFGNWKAAATDEEEWRKKVGEAMARKRVEAPQKKKKTYKMQRRQLT